MAKKRYLRTVFSKVLVPFVYGRDDGSLLAIASDIAGDGQVILLGLVKVPPDETLSAAAIQVREVRKHLRSFSGQKSVRIEEKVLVSSKPWIELVKYVHDISPDLLILEWPKDIDELQIPKDALVRPPCNVALLCGPIPKDPNNILVSLRGGPYAEFALQLSLAIGHNRGSSVTSLHIRPSNVLTRQDAPFRNIDRVLERMPEVNRLHRTTDNPIDTILKVASRYDLVVVGSTAHPGHRTDPIGPVATAILREGRSSVIVVRTKRPAPASFEDEIVGQTAISVLVDKWFAENTYHADEFDNLDFLVSLKRSKGLTISLALPALNEEATVGKVITTVKQALMDAFPLLDEIILIDSDSSDDTRKIATNLGIPVFIHQQTLPQFGSRSGKGEALWKSLYLTRGDIILWIDTDIVNIQPHFVSGLIGPLLLRPEVQLVKGFYRRPLRVEEKLQAGGGGRVTELTARPLLNLLYPELSGLIQPLAGEYGGRRTALETLPFSSGYGVEIGLLIDMLENFGLSSIAQVDLHERIHHNQPLEALSKMSFTIIQTVFRRLEKRYGSSMMDDMNRAMKLIRYEPGRFFLDVEELEEQERPPMLEIPEYRERFQR
jgi:glycosyltransferase involved in cell wall biosynthesis/nucleotide-binding universal stress UspA family protein